MESIISDYSFVEETLIRTAEQPDLSRCSRDMNLTSPVGCHVYGSELSIDQAKHRNQHSVDESTSEHFTDSPSVMEGTVFDTGLSSHIFPQISSTPLKTGLLDINNKEEIPHFLPNAILNDSKEVGFEVSSNFNLSEFWESMPVEKPESCEVLGPLTVVESMVNYSVISCDNVTLLFDALEVPMMSTSKQLPPSTPVERVTPGEHPLPCDHFNLQSDSNGNEISLDQNTSFSQSESKLSDLKTRSDFYTLAFINSFSENDHHISDTFVPPVGPNIYLDLRSEPFDASSKDVPSKSGEKSVSQISSDSKIQVLGLSDVRNEDITDFATKSNAPVEFPVFPMKSCISQLDDKNPPVFDENNLKLSYNEGSFNRLPVFTAITDDVKIFSNHAKDEVVIKNYTDDMTNQLPSLSYSDSILATAAGDEDNVSGLMLDYESKFQLSEISTELTHTYSPKERSRIDASSSGRDSCSTPDKTLVEKNASKVPVNASSLQQIDTPCPSMLASDEHSEKNYSDKLRAYERCFVSFQELLSGMKQDIYALQDNIVSLSDKNNVLSYQVTTLEDKTEHLEAERDILLSKVNQYEKDIVEEGKSESQWKGKYDGLLAQNEMHLKRKEEDELIASTLKEEIADLKKKVEEDDINRQQLENVSDELRQLRDRHEQAVTACAELTAENKSLMALKCEMERLLTPSEHDSLSCVEKDKNTDLIEGMTSLKALATENRRFLSEVAEVHRQVISLITGLITRLNSIFLQPCESDHLSSQFSEVLETILVLLRSFEELSAEDVYLKWRDSKFTTSCDFPVVHSKDDIFSSIYNLINNKLSSLETKTPNTEHESLNDKILACLGVTSGSMNDALLHIETLMAEWKQCQLQLELEKENNILNNNMKTKCTSMENKISALESAKSQLSLDLGEKIDTCAKLSSELACIKTQSDENKRVNEDLAKTVSSHQSEVESLKKIIEDLKEDSLKSKNKIISIIDEPSQSIDGAIRSVKAKLISYQKMSEHYEWTKSKLQDLDNECEELTSRNRDLEQCLVEATTKDSSEETRSELAKEKEVNGDLCSENFRLKVSLREMTDKNEELKELLLDLNKKTSTVQTKAGGFSESVEELKSELIEKNAKLTLMKVQIMRLKEEFDDRGVTVENYRRKVSELKNEIKNMGKRLDEVEQSRINEVQVKQAVTKSEPVIMKPRTADAIVQVSNTNPISLPSNFVQTCKVMDLTRKVEELKSINASLKNALLRKEEGSKLQKTQRSVFQDVTNT